MRDVTNSCYYWRIRLVYERFLGATIWVIEGDTVTFFPLEKNCLEKHFFQAAGSTDDFLFLQNNRKIIFSS